jgi:hypothetical protein
MLAFLVAPVAGKLTVRVQSRYLFGLGLFFVALSCELMSHVRADSSWTVLLPGFVAAGIGVGITNPVLASATVSVVPPERSGMATGSSSTFRQVGIATGIAGLGAVLLQQIRPNTVAALAGTPDGRAVLAHGGGGLSDAINGGGIRQAAASISAVGPRNALISAYKVGFTTTFDHLMAIASAVAIVGAVGSLLLVRQRDFVPSVAPEDLTAGLPSEPAPPPPPRRPRHAHSKRKRRRRERGRDARSPSRSSSGRPRPPAQASTDLG